MYANNLTNYTKYLSNDAVYCNDREVGSGTYSATGSEFDYKAYTRLVTNKTLSYDCINTNDKFTVSTSTGNGKLRYPIGLMTADEISFAGGVYGNNAPAYYYKNSAGNSSTGSYWWYTMSPFACDGLKSYVFYVRGSKDPAYFHGINVDNSGGVRPVTSLKSCVKWSSGDGSATTPYTILESESGC